MKLGIMQPYFFPYIGYFELIYQSNYWVVFDTAQYIRHGWINRNRILHPTSGWQHIVVPTRKHDQKTPIKEVHLAEEMPWRERLIGQLQHYRKKRAPFLREVEGIVIECISHSESLLSKLNIICLKRVCSYLDIPFRCSFFSEMNLRLGPIEGPGDWALRIAEALQAEEYINPPGGADLFDRSKFEAAGIKLSIQKPIDLVYDCGGYTFEPNLSIIDVMMWNSPDMIKNYLKNRRQQSQ